MRMKALIGTLCLSGFMIAAAQAEQTVSVEYLPSTEKRYPAKKKFFRLLEDHDLQEHQRPYEIIGRIKAEGTQSAELDWRKLEDVAGAEIKSWGADAVINLKMTQINPETGEPWAEEPDAEADTLLRLECDLIVYQDKDTYGHMGFWYNNRLQGIGGIRIEQIIRGSPAHKAGIQQGDILMGMAGENIGRVNIEEKLDYRRVQYKLRPGEEYQLLIDRKSRPKVITVIPRTEEEVFDWSKNLGGI